MELSIALKATLEMGRLVTIEPQARSSRLLKSRELLKERCPLQIRKKVSRNQGGQQHPKTCLRELLTITSATILNMVFLAWKDPR